MGWYKKHSDGPRTSCSQAELGKLAARQIARRIPCTWWVGSTRHRLSHVPQPLKNRMVLQGLPGYFTSKIIASNHSKPSHPPLLPWPGPTRSPHKGCGTASCDGPGSCGRCGISLVNIIQILHQKIVADHGWEFIHWFLKSLRTRDIPVDKPAVPPTVRDSLLIDLMVPMGTMTVAASTIWQSIWQSKGLNIRPLTTMNPTNSAGLLRLAVGSLTIIHQLWSAISNLHLSDCGHQDCHDSHH